MLIDCDTCRAPTSACRDCVMTMLLEQTPQPVELDDTECAALGSLAAAGLVPPLRLVVGVATHFDADADGDPEPWVTRNPGSDGGLSGMRPNRRGIA